MHDSLEIPGARRSLGAAIRLLLASVLAAGAATAGPDYLPSDAERARWTLADLRSWAIALEEFRVDHGRYPDTSDLEAAVKAIHPGYIRSVPRQDAWGHPLVYRVDPGGAGYVLVSPGADGRLAQETWAAEGELESFDEDAVMRAPARVPAIPSRAWRYR